MKTIPPDHICSRDEFSVRAMCAKAVQMPLLRRNRFRLIGKDALAEPKALYAFDYTLEYANGRHRIGLATACACPTKPQPIYLREGVARNVVLVMVEKQYLAV